MRYGADNRADQRGALADAVRPIRDQIGGIVIGPWLAADNAGPLEPRLHRRAVGSRPFQGQRPAATANGANQGGKRRLGDDDGSAPEFEIVERFVDIGIVVETAIGPRSDKGVVSHWRLLLFSWLRAYSASSGQLCR